MNRTTSSNAALSAENCQRLEALANQYADVELTSAQKQLKRKLVAWYAMNASATRAAEPPAYLKCRGGPRRPRARLTVATRSVTNNLDCDPSIHRRRQIAALIQR
jgi:hypothetical protein